MENYNSLMDSMYDYTWICSRIVVFKLLTLQVLVTLMMLLIRTMALGMPVT